MPGQEIAIPDGRAVSAPETPTGGHSSRTTGVIPVRLACPSLEAMVVINPAAPAAYAVITGDKAEEVKISWEGGTWTLRWPEDAGVNQGGQGTQIGSNNVQQNFFSGRRSYVSGGDSYAGGRTSNAGSSAPKEQPRVHLILPSGCSLHAELMSGSITVPAAADERHGLDLVSLSGMSASLHVQCAVREISHNTMSGDLTAEGWTGPVDAFTMSGDVSLFHAADNVTAQTMSGGISIHAEEDISVIASSTSGSVHVTAAEGKTPGGSGSSNGSVSVPASMHNGGRSRQRGSWTW